MSIKNKERNSYLLLFNICIFFIIIIFGFTFSFNFSQAQEQKVKAFATIDSSYALIGDQIHLKFNVDLQRGFSVNFPKFTDSIGKLLIIDKSKIDTISNAKGKSLSQTITLTSFDSGYFQIPSFDFVYSSEGDTNQVTAFTNALSVKYSTVAVDTTKPIKDIKPPLEIPFSIWDYIWYFVALIGFIALVLGIMYYFYKRKPKLEEIRHFDPKIPAHVQALKDLELLEQEKLWQQGKVKEYYSRLTDILRLYLERRLDFPALESTTSEIMYQIKNYISGSEILMNLQNVLELADLVKFAKHIPTPEENQKVIILTRNIVESTIPIDIETENIGEHNE